jgi:hypothetical protein
MAEPALATPPASAAPPPAAPPPSPAPGGEPAIPRAADRYAEYQRNRPDQGHQPPPPTVTQPQTETQPASRPPTQPDAGAQIIKLADGVEMTETELRDLLAHKAAEDSRRALVPASPDKYELKLPADLQLPAGSQFQLAPLSDPVKGPALRMAAEWAHRKGFSQAEFSEMLGVYAAAESQTQSNIYAAFSREKAALGTTGPARVDAIARWLNATLGADAKPMIATIATAAQVRSWEKIMQRLNGGGSFNAGGREPPEPRGPGMKSAEEVARMSPAERLDYSRQFDQRAMPSWRDPRGG